MSTQPTQIDFGCSDNRLCLRIRGPAVQAAALTLDRLVDDYLAIHPASPSITLDLADVPWIDSTIAGWLLRLLKRLAAANGSLILVACSDACRLSFDRMHLTGLFEIRPLLQPREWRTLDCAAPSTSPDRSAMKLMADAHAALANLDDENKRVFGPIAEMLRKQLESK